MQTPATPKDGIGPQPWIRSILPPILNTFMTREQSIVSLSWENPLRKEIKAMYMLWMKINMPIHRK